MSKSLFLEVVGADANNLRDIDCDFPLRGMSAIVGVSGSGKTSLLHEVIGVETARRNRLFHAIQTRRDDEPLGRAFVGTAPAMLFVGQRPFRSSSRTTIGTATGFLRDLRELFFAEGKPVTEAGLPVPLSNPETYTDWLITHYRGKATVWTIPLRWIVSDGVHAAASLVNVGINTGILRSERDTPEVHETGHVVGLTKWQPLPKDRLHSLEAEVGTVVVNGPEDRTSVHRLLSKAWSISNENVIVELQNTNDKVTVGEMGRLLDGARHCVHPESATLFRLPDRHLLSFNAPEHIDSGACPRCKGIGWYRDIDLDALVSSPDKAMHDGAISLWTPKNYKYLNIQHELIEGLRGYNLFDPTVPWRDLPNAAREMILNGTGEEAIQGLNLQTGKKHGAPRKFEGFRKAILRRTDTPSGTLKLADLVTEAPCSECKGSRWSPQASALQAAGRRLPEWLDLPMNELVYACRDALSQALTSPGRQALERMAIRAGMLTNLGLGHLSADRGMQSISDGESRRLQIGAVLAASRGHLLLLLDEPARGLHEKDLGPMVSILKNLSRRHCVLLNEHRTKIVAAADHTLTLGPGAGPSGGFVVPSATPSAIREAPLNSKPDVGKAGWLKFSGARIHNIIDQDVNLPLGTLCAVVGVSGSGKSSFARGILIPALIAQHSMLGDVPNIEDSLNGSWESVSGHRGIKKVHVLHQRVPPKNRRSLIGTMTGTLDILAKAFAATSSAQKAALSAKDFGLNGGSGRCPVCLGIGASIYNEKAPCSACGGERYGIAALTVRVSGLTISETLALPVSDLRTVWEMSGSEQLVESIGPLLSTMEELGLGHVALGRRVDSLSGGEIQRVRVAQILAGSDMLKGHLFFLDEPAAGLHREDADRLILILRRMVDKGRNTVVIVEHNLHILRSVDWLVEFGPGAGPAGGRVIASGTPASIAELDTPTGQALDQKPTTVTTAPIALEKLSDGDGDTSIDHIVTGDIDAPPKRLPETPDRLLTNRRLWEVGDLNLEIGKLLLDAWDERIRAETEHFLDMWKKFPDCNLSINPALTEIRIWGAHLPYSTSKSLLSRVKQMGLPLHSASDLSAQAVSLHPAILRTVLKAPNPTREAQSRALKFALAVGGGSAELMNTDAEVLAAVRTAPFDINIGLVATSVLTLEQLSRHYPEGKCPACDGHGTVLATDQYLILRSNQNETIASAEEVLTPQALAFLKGVWRSDAIPFFRRLAEEGLAAPSHLHDYLLFGFWHRPGHGSFLKKAKDDPKEVGSWLRWDGLFSYLWRELPRNSDAAWERAVERSRHLVPCRTCHGSGHGPAARLLALQGRSLADWSMTGTVEALRSALQELAVTGHRQEATRSRVLNCLPLTGKLGDPAEGYPDTVEALYRAFVVESS